MSIYLTVLHVLFVAISYVIAIHLKAKSGDRNDPSIIQSRLIRVSIASIIFILLTKYVLIYLLHTIPNEIAVHQILGLKNPFTQHCLCQVFNTLKLFMILFMGPLSELILSFIYSPSFESSYDSFYEVLRDLVIAPLTEEIFYTSLTTGPLLAYKLYQRGGSSTYEPTVFHNDNSISLILQLNPLLFGFAHLHHGYEMYHKGYRLAQIIGLCGFQCLYTTLFGYLTNLIFVNTGNIWCCFIAHSFCNFMGFPNISVKGNIFHMVFYWFLLILGVNSFGALFDKLTFIENAS